MREVTLSKRLDAVIGSVTPENRFVDVGTDHGFVPIALVQRGICPGGLAMDVRPGPLERARVHIREYSLEDRIGIRLSDGFGAMAPGEADTGILAGMGGSLMIRILQEGREQVQSLRELILSPQSDIREVRRYIRSCGFGTPREQMLCEDGKFYTVMQVQIKGSVLPCRDGFQDAEDLYGGDLLRKKDPVLLAFLKKEQEKKSRVLEKLSGIKKEEGVSPDRREGRYRSLQGELEQIQRIRECYYDL